MTRTWTDIDGHGAGNMENLQSVHMLFQRLLQPVDGLRGPQGRLHIPHFPKDFSDGVPNPDVKKTPCIQKFPLLNVSN